MRGRESHRPAAILEAPGALLASPPQLGKPEREHHQVNGELTVSETGITAGLRNATVLRPKLADGESELSDFMSRSLALHNEQVVRRFDVSVERSWPSDRVPNFVVCRRELAVESSEVRDRRPKSSVSASQSSVSVSRWRVSSPELSVLGPELSVLGLELSVFGRRRVFWGRS